MSDYFLKSKDEKAEHLIITAREDISNRLDIAIKVCVQSISLSEDPLKKLRWCFFILHVALMHMLLYCVDMLTIFS